MCGIVGIVGKGPVNQALYDALLVLQHRGPGRRRDRHLRGRQAAPAQGQRPGARRLPHPPHAAAAGQHGHRARALSHRRGVQLRRGPALLRQLPLRHRPGPQRQPDQRRGPQARPLRRGPAPHQHRFRLGDPAQRLRPRAADPGQAAHRRAGHLPRRGRRAPALPRRLRRGGHDPGLRHVRLPRPQRHPPHRLRPARDRRGHRVHDRLRERGPGHPGLRLIADVAPGEAVFIDVAGNLHTRQCASSRCSRPASSSSSTSPGRTPSSTTSRCTRPAAHGAQARGKIKRECPDHDIDVVIPVPTPAAPPPCSSPTPSASPYAEGFIKNRYIGRTFIMPGQKVRKKSVRQKLNAIDLEFRKKNVLLVDDSIVRGTTSQQIIQMARDAGAGGSTSPPPRRRCATPTSTASTCPSASELVAHGRTEERSAACSAPMADLPRPRRPDPGGAEEGQERRGPLRLLGLRRRLRHRRRDRGLPRQLEAAAQRRGQGGQDRDSESVIELYNSA
jgi:amidophosphoribosyltransferase